MSTTLTAKGQVTIPKIRDVLGLVPGIAVEFDIDEQGRIVICKASEKPSHPIRRDRFDRARGRTTVKWRTEELMRILRGDDGNPAPGSIPGGQGVRPLSQAEWNEDQRIIGFLHRRSGGSNGLRYPYP